MQCHNCKYSVTNGGTPDLDRCLKCKGADYLDNDHKTVNPVESIEKVSSEIDSSYNPKETSLKSNGDIIDYDGKKTKRNVEDCEKALKVLRKCHHTSLKFIAVGLAVLMSVGSNLPLLSSVLDGNSLIEYADSNDTSKQNIYQTWNRMMDENPIIAEITSSEVKKSRKRKSSSKKKKIEKRIKLG